MAIILTAQKVESSERDCPSKYEQTHNLVLICCLMQKKPITKTLLIILVIDLNKSCKLQVHFAKTSKRHYLRFHILILPLNSIKGLVCVISTSKIFQIFGPNKLKVSRLL